MTRPPDVRPITEADLPRAVETLGAAFRDYPYLRHVVDARDHLRRVTRFQELFLVELGMPHGRVWVADGGDAVAAWTVPDAPDAGEVLAGLGPELAELAGERATAASSAEAALAPHRPTEPVWFLGTVGVHPDRQGRGLGRAVLRPGIDAAEAAGVTAFLETSTERNVAFYQQLGFVVTADVELPDGGPRTWCMTRRPTG
ncbi:MULTISPECIES: GNAT family N-acetyltransferase [Actinoalloteichus]|uniref:Acetyltransferase (GNAT) family protein n=1 Tax=Actinoalloteichus fjordicus TaxID=1612552 RepID=A0AAC9PU46_9PSEU|nr:MULTISPECIES: GNAT family N-acetyltransferase [Actinoalloteichus]APU16700.1 acetyltransferase (GNAT) family protein [Actinoalloteichus fjordicus]APU22766.1 acetyltransferase (GNAT) family protein [Actinoalloteichus sp. GBA129-24]